MKIALGQLEILPGQPRSNLKLALEYLKQAQSEGADLLALPEMAIPGYLLGDLWDQSAFLREVIDCQNELVRASEKCTIAFGGLAMDWGQRGEDGRPRKFNAYFLAQNSKLVSTNSGHSFGVKTLMPNYREFDDSRYFYDSRKLAQADGVSVESLIEPFEIDLGEGNVKLGITLCEDAWDADYSLSPLELLSRKGSDVILNLSASPFTRGKDNKRNRLFSQAASKCGVPIAYCNATGIQNNGKTVYNFDGGSCVYFPEAQRSPSLAPFESGVHMVDLNCRSYPEEQEVSETAILKTALEYGTKKFMDQLGCSKVVIGVSGGIDSALAATVYRQVLSEDQLLLVNMPSRYNSKTTISAASELAENLGCLHTTVSIQQSVDHSVEQFNNLKFQKGSSSTDFNLSCSEFTQENIQARDRSGRVLAGLSACFGGVFTCNANKSETAVGYSTLYGDHAGFFANLADLWKHQVYALANEYNRLAGTAVIPAASIDMVPAAELNASQNPEKGQGDPFTYAYHDALFSKWVEDWERKTPEEILEWYLEGNLADQLKIEPALLTQLFPNAEMFIKDLERWWRCYCGLGVAKRIQAPPILAFSRRAFGFDHREAQLGILHTKNYQSLKARALK